MSGFSRSLSLPSVFRSSRLPDLRRPRRFLVVGAILALVAAAGYLFWLRDSSLVAVERVTINGAESEPAVAAALEEAAEGMTTLHVDTEALQAAVADDPSVLSLTASPDFPHGLTIAVDVRRPVGFVESGGIVLAGDGVVLESGAEQPAGIPVIDAELGGGGEARAEGAALALSRVLAGAPEVLLAEAGSATVSEEFGPVVEVGQGTELRFGDPSQAELKWSAAATVLADPDLDNAAYIDLSVPARPVAG